MGDSFTNFLLIILISLLGYIGKMFYEKVEDILKRIEAILLSDITNKKDIEGLKEDVEGHETRISYLERKK